MNTSKIRYSRSVKVISQEIEGETILLDMLGENYYSLDKVGTRIWQLLETVCNRERIYLTLLEEFDVTAETLSSDLDEILEHLLTTGLIVEVPARTDV